MDAETVFAMFFMLIGLAFFMHMIRTTTDNHERRYERDLQRDREFGLNEPRKRFSPRRSTR